MNLVVAESHRRRGIAKALLDDVFGRTDGAGRRGFTLEVRASERRRAAALRGDGLPPPGRPARLLHGQPRGRRDHVARRRGRWMRRDPRARDLLRRDGGGSRHLARRRARQRRRLTGRAARAVRRRRAGGGGQTPSRARVARDRGGSPRGGRDPRRRRARCGHARAGARRRAARRAVGGQGAGVGAVAAASPPSTTCTGTSRRSSSVPTRSSRRSCASSPRVGTRWCSR